jgi:thiamine biosynthesis lipoprotein
VERRLALMGTSLELSVGHDDRRSALLASEAAVRALERTEARLSTWRDDSELARLNRAEPGKRVPLSPELAEELGRARELSSATGGAFDPAIGALVEAWGLRTGGRLPGPEELEAARVPGGLGALVLGVDPGGAHWARRTVPTLRIEEGGFGKGAGLDRAIAALHGAGARSAVLDLGGQVALFGGPEAFGIADPHDRQRAVLTVRVDGGSFATSGNSERAVEVDGVRIGHLLDPRTGRPAPDFGSVTVFAPDAITADALSTGAFVLGPRRALELADRLPGVEVLVLDARGERLRALATAGLRGRLETNDSTLRVEWHSPLPTGAPRGPVRSPSPRTRK